MKVEEKIERDLISFFRLESDCIDKLLTRYTKRELNVKIASLGLKKLSFYDEWSDLEHELLRKMYLENDRFAELKLSLLGRNPGMARDEAGKLGLIPEGLECDYSACNWSFYELKELREGIGLHPDGNIPTLQKCGRTPIACRQRALVEGFV